ncbi:hypothetical protein L1887_59875 [Cichorium endivia]|nr:hypothetical protein L1887_59875 [Cichorium endivia]
MITEENATDLPDMSLRYEHLAESSLAPSGRAGEKSRAGITSRTGSVNERPPGKANCGFRVHVVIGEGVSAEKTSGTTKGRRIQLYGTWHAISGDRVSKTRCVTGGTMSASGFGSGS